MKQLWAFIKVNLKDALQYREDILLFTLSGAAQPIVSLLVWSVISSSTGNSLPLSQNQILEYFIILMFVKVVTSAWGGWFVSQDIKEGNISKLLLKPTSIFYEQMGNNISEKILKIIYLIPIVAIIQFFNPFNINFSLIPIFIPALLVSVLMMFLFDLTLTTSAFWLEENGAVYQFFEISMFFLSGSVIPLIVMPDLIRAITNYLPFRYIISFPIEILMGSLTDSQIVYGFVMQVIWLFFAICIYKFCWKKGFKAYSASGA